MNEDIEHIVGRDGWLLVRELGHKDRWIATDTPAEIEE